MLCCHWMHSGNPVEGGRVCNLQERSGRGTPFQKLRVLRSGITQTNNNILEYLCCSMGKNEAKEKGKGESKNDLPIRQGNLQLKTNHSTLHSKEGTTRIIHKEGCRRLRNVCVGPNKETTLNPCAVHDLISPGTENVGEKRHTKKRKLYLFSPRVLRARKSGEKTGNFVVPVQES